jgi:hypothetical protein
MRRNQEQRQHLKQPRALSGGTIAGNQATGLDSNLRESIALLLKLLCCLSVLLRPSATLLGHSVEHFLMFLP